MKRKSRRAKDQKVSPFNGELELIEPVRQPLMWAAAVIG
jgi:hypothetical protein